MFVVTRIDFILLRFKINEYVNSEERLQKNYDQIIV